MAVGGSKDAPFFVVSSLTQVVSPLMQTVSTLSLFAQMKHRLTA
jgi:hypothetical protein